MGFKRALVTGGSSGIGRATALRLATGGLEVAVVASSDVAKAQRVADEIVERGGRARAYAADVSKRDEATGLVHRVVKDLGGVDVLVNAAGIFIPNAIGVGEVDAFDRTIDVNLKGPLYCIEAVVPHMQTAGGGRIVNIASVAATLGVKGYSAYCASKAAVSMLTRALALELAPLNININAVAPGNTATPLNEALRTDPAYATYLAGMKDKTPSQRLFSLPEDIAELVWFLTSPAAVAMHGSTLLMDEGLSAGI